jgi:hypothetical protein
MNKLIVVAMLLLAAAAVAQTPPPNSNPQAAGADMEPGVNTSAPSAAPQPVTATAPPAAKPSTPKPGTAGAKPPATNAAATAATPNNGKPGAAKGNAKDRLDLESTQITGNRELPKVLYIVPWRSAELGDLVGRPVNSLLDEVLEPVDRDVFRRQNRYFDALQPNEATPASKPEK